VLRPECAVKMMSTSKTEPRTPDTHGTGDFTATVLRSLRGGFVVLVVVTLAVEWLHIDDLRRRVSELEQSCQSASTDKPLLTLLNDHQPGLSDDQRYAAEVCGMSDMVLIS